MRILGIWSLVTVKPHSSLPPPLSTVSYGTSFCHTQSWEAVPTSVCSTETPGLQPAVWSPRHASCLAQGQNAVPGAKQVPRKGITSQDQPKHSTGLRAGVPTSPLLYKSSSSCPHPLSQQSTFLELCRFKHTKKLIT